MTEPTDFLAKVRAGHPDRPAPDAYATILKPTPTPPGRPILGVVSGLALFGACWLCGFAGFIAAFGSTVFAVSVWRHGLLGWTDGPDGGWGGCDGDGGGD